MDHAKLVQVQRRSRRHMHVAFARSNPLHYSERICLWLEATLKGTLYRDDCRDGWQEGETVAYSERRFIWHDATVKGTLCSNHNERHLILHQATVKGTLCGTVLAAGLIPLNFAARTPLTPQVGSRIVACDCEPCPRHRLLGGATCPPSAVRSQEPAFDHVHMQGFGMVDGKPFNNLLAWRSS